MSRLNLAIVSETYPPEVNGVAFTLSRFIEGLRARHHQIQLIRPRQTAVEQAAQGQGFDELLTGGMPIPRYSNLIIWLSAPSALIGKWQLRRPDLVYIVTEGPARLVGVAGGA